MNDTNDPELSRCQAEVNDVIAMTDAPDTFAEAASPGPFEPDPGEMLDPGRKVPYKPLGYRWRPLFRDPIEHLIEIGPCAIRYLQLSPIARFLANRRLPRPMISAASSSALA